MPAEAQRVFTVLQLANLPRSDMDGYYQYFEAYDGDDMLVASVYSGSGPDGRVVVQRRLVRTKSGTGSEAIRRFREWLSSGLPSEWLLESAHTQDCEYQPKSAENEQIDCTCAEPAPSGEREKS